MEYTYCFIRKDLPLHAQIIQTAHACLQSPTPKTINSIVLFEVKNEEHLIKTNEYLTYRTFENNKCNHVSRILHRKDNVNVIIGHYDKTQKRVIYKGTHYTLFEFSDFMPFKKMLDVLWFEIYGAFYKLDDIRWIS